MYAIFELVYDFDVTFIDTRKSLFKPKVQYTFKY